MSGGLRIPNTAGDLNVDADLRARQITASIEINAPQDKGARGRVSWLVGQLGGASDDLVLEAYPKNARVGTAATLGQTREDRFALLDGDHKDPFRFKVTMRTEMGMGRKAGTRTAGFITTVLDLVERFYGDVVQQITPWQPPAPKLKQAKPATEAVDDDQRPYDPFSRRRVSIRQPRIVHAFDVVASVGCACTTSRSPTAFLETIFPAP